MVEQSNTEEKVRPDERQLEFPADDNYFSLPDEN